MQTIDGEIVNQPPMPTQASTSTAVAVVPTPLHVPQNAVALNFSNMPAQYKAAQGSSHLMDNAVAGIERFTLYKIVPRAGTLVLQSGSMVLDTPRPYYDVIFLGVSKLTRVYYANKFDANQPENVPPTCGSDDSEVPSPHVPIGNIPKFFNSITQQMETVTRCDQCPMSKKPRMVCQIAVFVRQRQLCCQMTLPVRYFLWVYRQRLFLAKIMPTVGCHFSS